MAHVQVGVLSYFLEGGQQLTYCCNLCTKPPAEWPDMGVVSAGNVGDVDMLALYEKGDEYLVCSRPGYNGNPPSEFDGKLWRVKKAEFCVRSCTLNLVTGAGQPVRLQLSADGTARFL